MDVKAFFVAWCLQNCWKHFALHDLNCKKAKAQFFLWKIVFHRRVLQKLKIAVQYNLHLILLDWILTLISEITKYGHFRPICKTERWVEIIPEFKIGKSLVTISNRTFETWGHILQSHWLVASFCQILSNGEKSSELCNH